MNTYFRGWRRKLGVVTLLLACVFAAAWVRSLRVDDRYFIRGVPDGEWEYFVSTEGEIGWINVNMGLDLGISEGADIQLVDLFGFPAGNRIRNNDRVTKLLIIPYWSFVIPPTVFSAWLLLGKLGPSQMKRHGTPHLAD